MRNFFKKKKSQPARTINTTSNYHDNSSDLLNPLNPLSPISVWNNSDSSCDSSSGYGSGSSYDSGSSDSGSGSCD